MYNFIISEKIGKLGILTLNSERSLNSLSVQMIEECQQVLEEWKRDDSVACIFMQGAGEKAFCAGGDVRKLRSVIVEHLHSEAPDTVAPGCIEYFVKEYTLDYEVHKYPKPIVVWGDGIVMGGGIGVSNGASHRIVTEKSTLAMPEITIGLYPDVGATWFLNKLPSAYGVYLGVTGTRLNAGDAIYLALADHFVPSSERKELLESLTQIEWSETNSDNHESISRIIQLHEKRERLPESPAREHAEFIAKFESVSSVDEFAKVLNEYRHASEWVAAGAKIFDAGSPSSVHITFEQLRRGKSLSLEDVFRSELNLSCQCGLRQDFAEGVRALLVDKDNKPNWQPASLSEVSSQEWVKAYFEPLWNSSNHPLRHLGKETASQK